MKLLASVTLGLWVLCATLSGCATKTSDRYDERSSQILDAFSQVCYDHANEWIKRKAGRVTSLTVSPRSQIANKWNGDLFYSTGTPPDSWQGISTTVELNSESTGGPGGFALRYSYIPEVRTVGNDKWTFHGVRIQVVDLAANEVIAERRNYIFGGDFNRADQCLNANWYSDNEDFANRVLGHRYIDPKTGKPYLEPVPNIYVKAIPIRTEDVTVSGVINLPKTALPPGVARDPKEYRILILPEGKMYIPQYWNNEPIPIAGAVETPDMYIFVMTPDGWMRSTPIHQLMFMYRKRNGDWIKNIYVQIPPGVEWRDGWGINPSDVLITEHKITFSLLGRKKAEQYTSPTYNEGTYQRRYVYSASIP